MTESRSAQIDTSDMKAVHTVFRTSLASAPDFIASAEGDDERRSLIANYYANVMNFLEVHHDGEEHLVFPLLVDRAPEQQTVIENVASQHADVHDPVAAVKDSFNAWEVHGDTATSQVLASIRALETALSPHLDDEEEVLLPLASEHLTAEEWGQLPAHGMMHFTGDKIWLVVGLIRENFSPEQREMMLEHMPPPARQMWEGFGEASFNALIDEVRQTN